MHCKSDSILLVSFNGCQSSESPELTGTILEAQGSISANRRHSFREISFEKSSLSHNDLDRPRWRICRMFFLCWRMAEVEPAIVVNIRVMFGPKMVGSSILFAWIYPALACKYEYVFCNFCPIKRCMFKCKRRTTKKVHFFYIFFFTRSTK